MFGAICSGWPVQPAIPQADPTKYVLQFDYGAHINHIVVFLMPDAILDPQYAATVYFQLPGQDFQLLGAISASKPSAIFKINNNKSNQTNSIGQIDDMEMSDANPIVSSGIINVGISIEPVQQVEQALTQLKAQREIQQQQQQNNPPISAGALASKDINSTAILANKIVQHAYNFLSGFVDNQGKVSMKTFDEWWNKFKRKLQMDPRFLDSLD